MSDNMSSSTTNRITNLPQSQFFRAISLICGLIFTLIYLVAYVDLFNIVHWGYFPVDEFQFELTEAEQLLISEPSEAMQNLGIQRGDILVAINGDEALVAELAQRFFLSEPTFILGMAMHNFGLIDSSLNLKLDNSPRDISLKLNESNNASVRSFMRAGFSFSVSVAFLYILDAVQALSYIFLFWFIYWQRSDDWLAMLVVFGVLAWGINIIFTKHFASITMREPILTFLIFYSSYISAVFGSLTFPDAYLRPRHGVWILPTFIIGVFLMFNFIHPIYSIPQFILENQLLFFSLITLFNVIVFLFMIIYKVRTTQGLEHRQQIQWAFVGTIALVFTANLKLGFDFLAFILPSEIYLILLPIVLIIVTFGVLCVPISGGIAILRYHIYDINVAVNRSLVGIVVTIVLVAFFIGSIFIIQSLLGAENTLVAFAVSAIGPALLFRPVQKRARNFIDKRIYGLRFDMNEIQAANRSPEITKSGDYSGKTLGNYEVLDLLGKGGMGEVYLGIKDAETVAIKTLHMGTYDVQVIKRFIREAQTGLALDHRNIAKVYDVGEQDGVHYLVMEYIEGQDLENRIEQDGILDTETAIRIMQDICAGLVVAHEQGIVHRDIKPSNVMLRENGEAVLMDFGIAKALDKTSSLTGTGMIGTPTYMAPEQIKSDKQLDHRADIYSLGIMLYEMLSGEKPFSGSIIQVIFSQLNQPPPDIQEKVQSLSFEIADAIDKAMAKDPDDRFQTVSEFGASLEG